MTIEIIAEQAQNGFAPLGLRPELEQAIEKSGYTEPTDIQASMIPLMMTGQDVIGQAQTGTGKTAAFSLPILQNLVPGQGTIQSLVLAPTRELAMQVAKSINEYGQFLNVRVLAVYGGSSYDTQIRSLRRGVDVVVGTPGRMLDLIKRGKMDLSHVNTVVLDEADEMLSMGFIEDIESILSETPVRRQTALFSATMPQPIRRLADKYMNDPQSITIKRKEQTVSSIEQRYYLVNGYDKAAALTRLFEVEPLTSTLIFVRTRQDTEKLATELKKRGFPAEAISGDLSQQARERVLSRFRQGTSTVMVATDVAARGLDIDNISHVFNYDIPQDPETYVHRVGRTGRAGREGVAITLVTPKEQWQLRRIEGFTKHQLQRGTLPTIDEIKARREEELMEQFMIWLRRGRCRQEKAIIERLIGEGHDPIELAAIALKMARAEEKQRPIADVSEVREVRGGRQQGRGGRNGRDRGYGGNRGGRESGRGRDGYRGGRDNGRARDNYGGGRDNYRSRDNGGFQKRERRTQSVHEEGMVRLALSQGKSQGVRPNDVVSTLAYYADIPGSAIGKIWIENQNTLVDVPEQFVDKVLSKTGQFKMKNQSVQVERA